MRSRRRQGPEHSDTTKRYSAPPTAPNYSNDDAETLIRVLPLHMQGGEGDDDDGFDEMTMRVSSIH